MDISYFREFVVLSLTKNFWEASERLFISESSLSKHIKNMEKELGTPLFERTSRKVELTEFGRQFLLYAQSITKLQYEYESLAATITSRKGETLSIAMIPSMTYYGIVNILVQFETKYPSVQVVTNEVDTVVIRKLLLERKCDLAIYRESSRYLTHDPEKEDKIMKLPLWTDRLMAVLPKNHPLEKSKSIALSSLQNESFALIKKGTMPYSLCVKVCQEAGFTPHITLTSHNLDAIFDMVTKGNSIALLFENHIPFPKDPILRNDTSFAVIPIEPQIVTTLCLAYLRNISLSTAAKHFVRLCMVESEKSLDPKNF